MANILVTGGIGYIGSHICVELLTKGYDVTVIDNLSNSSELAIKRIESISGKRLKFYFGDIRDAAIFDNIFSSNSIYAVIHLAGLKAVGESVREPLKYFDNNIHGTNVLLSAMKKHNVKKFIFSSSATVYGTTQTMPLTEEMPTGVTSPYGRTKLVIEDMLKDLYVSDNEFSIVLLRYFNPIGAHKSGLIGENPNGEPNNLMPYITQVAIGKKNQLKIFGSDYNTPDGTCLRDYIHVVDLSLGHLAALKKLEEPRVHTYNLGTGTPNSVLEIIHAFEKANSIKINSVVTNRREGDVPMCYACADRAKKELGWHALNTLEEMCKDSFNFQKLNPNGYEE